MNDLWFIPLIGILGVVSTILSSKGSLFDKRYKWYSRLTLRGKIVSFLGLCIVILSVLQYIVTRKEEKKKEKDQILQQNINDSIVTSKITKGIDENRKKLFYDLSEALAKQALTLDTVTKTLQKVKDSARTVIIKSPNEIPIIIIRENGITSIQKNDSTIEFKIQLITRQAASKIKYINYLCELHYINGTTEKSNFKKFIIGDFLVPKEETYFQTFELVTHKDLYIVNIAFDGIYTSGGDNHEIKFRELYQYFYSTKSFTHVAPNDAAKFFESLNIK